MEDHRNKVVLIGHYGSDLTHALSAWTSTSRDLTPEKLERVPSLLKMLASEGHHTPFEKSTLHFLVVADTASHIHILKHRIAVSVNGESARYKELKEDKIYVPEDWPIEEQQLYHEFALGAVGKYHECLKRLEPALGRKRAKESARYYLPYGNQLTLDVSFNWRSFMHFVGLRWDDHAQLEIRNIAGRMLELVREIEDNPFRHSLEAFGY